MALEMRMVNGYTNALSTVVRSFLLKGTLPTETIQGISDTVIKLRPLGSCVTPTSLNGGRGYGYFWWHSFRNYCGALLYSEIGRIPAQPWPWVTLRRKAARDLRAWKAMGEQRFPLILGGVS